MLRSFLQRAALSFALSVASLAPAAAQVVPASPPATSADTIHKFENPAGVPAPVKQPWYKGKLVKAVAVPAVLIGYGAYTFNGGGFYTNQEANRDIHKLFPTFRTKADDILIFAPYAELGLVALAGVESRNDRINVGLVVLKSELIMLTTVFAVKHLSRETRPDGSDNLSFPSGHTAQAFLAASIVHNEFRDKSQWYGIGAYTIATSVAALRMINNKHWQSDVVAGAGFGILSAHLGYLTHRNRWGRKPRLPEGMSFTPTWQSGYAPGQASAFGGGPGLRFTWQPK
ncbi:membrane-associated phospholipid phosphatase [Hymenobacter luteus]|uniref:Membrane-associated phospholipid phosphatase n=2 Tax=Hymenobacter TaxID=89966 RepID=A0A7W9W9K2_9BACT|nr:MULTISPECIES: phosphatase PAP2 family protein [Hymenobacter]MBB4599946.1 membrane-associated phospholipid phosphatase [Hymenobacter latericoloratus]MBB6057744.1 membrane-associated phospholipid phosphatase [Hymenobacter luteus]